MQSASSSGHAAGDVVGSARIERLMGHLGNPETLQEAFKKIASRKKVELARVLGVEHMRENGICPDAGVKEHARKMVSQLFAEAATTCSVPAEVVAIAADAGLPMVAAPVPLGAASCPDPVAPDPAALAEPSSSAAGDQPACAEDLQAAAAGDTLSWKKRRSKAVALVRRHLVENGAREYAAMCVGDDPDMASTQGI